MCLNTFHCLQLECFEQCTSHVVTSVPQEDWKTWARSLAGDCQASPDLPPDTPTSPAHRLTCADSHLWLTMSKIVNLSDHVGRKCLKTICNDNVKCGKQCLKHVDKMEHVHRYEEIKTGVGYTTIITASFLFQVSLDRV